MKLTSSWRDCSAARSRCRDCGQGSARLGELLLDPRKLDRQTEIGHPGARLLDLRSGRTSGVADQQPDGVFEPARGQAKTAANQPCADHG